MIKSYKDKVERGVSPVVGVIVMVAVTVILAAVVGTFVLDLGGSVNETGQAGFDIETQANGQIDTDTDGTDNPDTTEYKVEVDPIKFQENIDKVKIEATDTDDTQVETDAGGSLEDYDPSVGTSELTSVRGISEVTQLTEGDKVTVIAVVDGEENVVDSVTVE